MADIKRNANVEQTLTIKPCPFCGGSIKVTDCGYHSCNPGCAECEKCERGWKLGYVDDSWDAGIKWNNRHPFLVEIEDLENSLSELRAKAKIE